MINLANQFRLRNLLPFPSPNQPNAGVIDNPAVISEAPMEGYEPDFTMRDQMLSLLGQYPQREEPSGWDRVSAALTAAFSGGPAGMWGGVPVGYKANPNSYAIQQAALNQPYKQAVEDFEGRLKPIEAMTELEADANQEKRLFKYQSEGRRLEGERIKAASEKEDRMASDAAARQKTSDERLELDRKKLELAEFRAKNPNWQFKTIPGGNVIAFNPANPTEAVDTGIDSGTLSDLEKRNMALEDSLTKIEAYGDQSRLTRQTPTAAQQAAAAKGETPAAKKARLINKATDIINQFPELRDFFEVNPTTGVPSGVLNEPPKPWFGNKKVNELNQYDRAKALFLEGEPEMEGGAPSSETFTPPSDPLVEVINPSGVKVKILTSQLAVALTKGYKEVGK